MSQPKKQPKINELSQLVKSIKKQISDEYRVSDDPDDKTPGIQLTVGHTPGKGWSYQTGDNSYTGGAYGFELWGVVGVYRRSNSTELAREILEQILDQIASSK